MVIDVDAEDASLGMCATGGVLGTGLPAKGEASLAARRRVHCQHRRKRSEKSFSTMVDLRAVFDDIRICTRPTTTSLSHLVGDGFAAGPGS